MPHAHQAAVESQWISVALSLVAVFYLHRWLRVAWLVPHGVEGWRAGSFFVGVLMIWAALASPLALLDHDLLTVHMVQHLLLMTLAPPLILLGAPLKMLPRFPTQKWEWMQLHLPVAWVGANATLVVWHVPSVFTLCLQSERWHGIEQASFLATGLLFWWPVIERSRKAVKWPESSILLYLFLATLPCDILSGFLVFCDRVVYPAYLSPPRQFGMTALEDQQCAGALMWTCVTLVYVIAAAIVTARLLSSHGSQEHAIRQSGTQAITLRKSGSQRMETV